MMRVFRATAPHPEESFMKRVPSMPVALCLAVLALGACTDSKPPAATESAATEGAATLQTEEQRMGYSLGAMMGRQFRDDKLQVDAEALARGVREGYSAETLSMSDEEIGAGMQQLQTSHSERMQNEQNAQAENNLAASQEFMAKNATEEGVVTTESGLQYRVITAAEGAKPSADDTVRVHYRGTLIDGTEFDSSYKRGEPVTFPVGGVIPGWVEALQLMPVGSKWNLYVPSELAYGPGGAGQLIGPNSALIFEVELLAIEPPAAASDE